MNNCIVKTHGAFSILRDDLLGGGTKRRALELLIPRIKSDIFIYAGTIFGAGVLALAYACKSLGRQAIIYLNSNDPDHPVISDLKAAGAKIIMPDTPQPVAMLYQQARAAHPDAHLFPPGFAVPEFEHALAEAIKAMDIRAHNIWCSAVSGTLCRALQQAKPDAQIHTVSVVKSEENLGSAMRYQAPEKYHQPARNPPPYPACPYTDAKIWQFAKQHAKPGALIWNISA